MKRPLFQIGDKVFYKRRNRVGTVESVLNFGNREDVQIQGFRYYVRIGYEMYSLREDSLLLHEKKSNKIKPKLEVASFILSTGQQMPMKEGGALTPTPEDVLLEKDEEGDV